MKKRTFWVRSVTTKRGYHRVFWGVQRAAALLRTVPWWLGFESCNFAQQKRRFCRVRLTSRRSHLPVRPFRQRMLQSERIIRAKKAASAIFL